jgi:hypothetical protein
MDNTQGRRAERIPQPGDVCPSCGGSGVLRTDSVAYRTCLVCVGQGVLPQFEASGFSPAVVAAAAAAQARRPRRHGFRGDLSAWSSGG